MDKGDIITLIICALSGISIELLSAKMNDWWKNMKADGLNNSFKVQMNYVCLL